MVNEPHVSELLAAYALGSLDEEEQVQVAGHLTACADCRAELLSYEAVAGRLAFAAPDAAPPAALKQQILGGIQTPHQQPAVGPQRSWRQQLAGFFRTSAPAWRVASLALVVLLVITNVWWWQRAGREGSGVPGAGMRVIAMAGAETAPDAVGTLVISADGEYGTLVVDGLPALDPEHQYQLWLIRDGQRTSGGVFSVNPEGYGSLPIPSPEPLSSYAAFGITIEPAGGSPGPTGDKVLGSQ